MSFGLVYFCYYAAIGILMPYWGLYAAHLGLAPSAIGAVAAAPMLTKIVAPNLWALLADRHNCHLLAVRGGALLAALAALLLPGAGSFVSLLAATLLFSFFWNAILPQIEVVVLDSLASRGGAAAYGRVRLWGSVGFIAAAAGLGGWLAGPQIARAPVALLLAVLATAVAVWWLPRPAGVAHANSQADAVAPCRWFFVAAFMLQVSHGVFYGFYSLFLQDTGYSSSAIGLLWGAGVVAEVALFWWAPQVMARLGLRNGYLLAGGAAVLRWQCIALFAGEPAVMWAVQALHALTFALAHAVAVETVRRYYPGAQRGTGQALYSALCFGGGAALGSWAGGWLYEWDGSMAFHGASAVAMIAVLLTFRVRWPVSAES